MKTHLTVSILSAAVIIAMSNVMVHAAPQNNGQPADTIHPNIHDKVGQGDGTNANPNGQGNGGQIHGIGNVPGQSGADPSDGDPGFADQLETVHGGIGAYNPNADVD